MTSFVDSLAFPREEKHIVRTFEAEILDQTIRAVIMAKSGKKDSQQEKKDQIQAKKGSGSIVKAKNKRKKINPKKVIEKVGKDIATVNGEFTELQPKLVLEKKSITKMKHDKNDKVSTEPSISQAKQVEATTEELANL